MKHDTITDMMLLLLRNHSYAVNVWYRWRHTATTPGTVLLLDCSVAMPKVGDYFWHGTTSGPWHRVQNATSEDRCMWGTAYNDDRISQKKRFKKKKIKRFFFFYFKKGGGSLIRACSLIRSNTVYGIIGPKRTAAYMV